MSVVIWISFFFSVFFFFFFAEQFYPNSYNGHTFLEEPDGQKLESYYGCHCGGSYIHSYSSVRKTTTWKQNWRLRNGNLTSLDSWRRIITFTCMINWLCNQLIWVQSTAKDNLFLLTLFRINFLKGYQLASTTNTSAER